MFLRKSIVIKVLMAAILALSFSLIKAQSVDLSLASGFAPSPQGGGNKDVLFFGVQLHKNNGGANTLTALKVLLSQDPTGIITNARLIRSSDNVLDGGDAQVSVGTLNASPARIDFAGTPINDFNGGDTNPVDRWFFVLVDIVPSTSTTTLQPSLTQAQLTVSSSVVNAGTATGTNYTINAAAATLAEVTVLPVPGTALEAGSSAAVLAGFSIVSNGTQSINQVDFTVTGGAGKLSTYKLYSTTTAGIVGASVATGTGSVSFTGLTEVISGTTTYYYLVGDVNNALTSATPSASVTLDQTNITLNAGAKSTLSINRSITFTESQATVTASYTGQGSITNTEYSDTQSTPASVTSGNSQKIFAIDVTDGDTDNHNTTITQLAFNVTNFANLATISLFDGATKVGTSQTVSGGTITFSGLSYVINDGTVGSPNTNTLDIRVTFKANVTDNDMISVQLTGATTLAGGSGLASFAGIQTGGGKNPITVVATQLIFINAASPPPPYAAFLGPLNIPPAPQSGSTFSATVWAVDDSFNLDTDENSSVSLNVSVGPGSLTGGGAQALVGGVKLFGALSVNSIGTYDLNATDGAGGLSDAKSSNSTNIDLIIESLGVSFSAANLSTCKVGSGNFFTVLPSLVLTESDNTDFTPGTNLTFLLILPSGWEFLTPSTTTPTPAYTAPTISYTPGKNFTAATFSNFIGTNIAKFTYSVSGTTQADALTISGLYIKNVSGVATGDMYRSGTGLVKGANVLGTLTTSTSATVVDFNVQELPGNPTVPPGQTAFNISSNAVKLIGSPTGGGFAGSPVNPVIISATNGPTFEPSTIGVGTFPITYTYMEPAGQHCQIEVTKNFTVIANYINGLLNSYCTSSASSSISVPQATVDLHFPPAATYTFKEFVYYEPSLSVFVTIPAPNATFNPANPIFNNSINTFGGVYIAYRVKDASNVVLADGVFFQNLRYIFIRIIRAPILSFNLPTSTCVNATPIDLDNLVVPAPNASATDNFTALTSVSMPSANQWVFTPSTVPGANASQQNVNITYNYKDPGTACTNSITKIITVNPTPAQVPSIAISPTTTIELCQGGIVGSFTAQTIPGVTYNWYSDNSLSLLSLQRQADFFSPVVSNTIATTTDFFVTQTINGCESTLPRQVSVIVDPTPAAPGSDFSRSYCLNSTVPGNDFTITGSSVKWYSSTDNFTTPVFLGNNPTASNIGVATTVANAYSFQTTQTSNKSCESPPIKVLVTIKDLPVLTITSSVTDLTKICRSNDDINFKANQPNGIWSGTASSALFNTIPALGSTQLRSLNLPPGTFSLKYDYTDAATTCSNTTTASLTIFPTIVPALTVSDACDGFFVDLTNNSTIFPVSATSTIDSIAWDFGDQSSLPLRLYTKAIPAGFSSITRGTFGSPSHLFKSVGTFSVNYLMKTSDGCQVAGTKQVINHEVPKAAFTGFNSCFDNNTNTASVQFAGANMNSNLSAGEIQSYTWNFATTSALTVSSPGVGKNPLTTYSSIGRDSVQLIVITINNCKDTIQKPVFIVPSYPAITENNSYYEDFNTTSGGWINGGTNSSWQHGKPAAPKINRDSSATGTGQAWVTNLTGNNNANEQSWVLSQCYDFSQAFKPVFSFDIWSDTPRPIDGAVLQYNETNNIELNANWNVVGQINQGVNWYDINGIASKPGNQSSIDVGWSGDKSLPKYKKGWVHAVFKLDNLIGKPNVKFRIAFASNFGKQEGFAFDNVFIGERSRSVLIENFTNTSAAANATSQNNFFNTFGGSTTEIVKVQFHTGFPGYDTLNAINKSMNNARTAFYGITNSPTIRIDGQIGTGALASWFGNLYDERVLNPSPLKIVINAPVKVGDVVNITASITNTTSSPLNLKNANVFIIIAEKSITTMPWLGQSGNSEFKYVAKQMLPTRSGISIGKTLAPGETFTIPQVVWNERDLINSGNGVIIAYVQSLLSDKEVYQAKVYDNPVQPDITTGIEQILAEHIKLYPNPADQSVTLELPEAVLEQTPVHVFDINGHEVKSITFEKGQHSHKIGTEDFAGGVYLIQLKTSYATIRKKIVILHQ